eukprot:5195141-Pyramimonas_sp.AAC.2
MLQGSKNKCGRSPIHIGAHQPRCHQLMESPQVGFPTGAVAFGVLWSLEGGQRRESVLYRRGADSLNVWRGQRNAPRPCSR